MISFTVPAVPVAQPRARATAINGHTRMYEAASSHPIHAFKASVRLAAKEAYSGPPLEGTLRISAQFIFPRPQRLCRKKDPETRIPCDGSRCDVDNLLKGILDALNELTWKDDRQVCAALVVKEYAAKDEQPHVSVTIEELI